MKLWRVDRQEAILTVVIVIIVVAVVAVVAVVVARDAAIEALIGSKNKTDIGTL